MTFKRYVCNELKRRIIYEKAIRYLFDENE